MSDGSAGRSESPLGRPAGLSAGAMQAAVGFSRAMLNRDVEGAFGYLSASARVLTADGTEVAGQEAITGVLKQLATSNQRLEIRPGRTVVTGGVALCQQSWRLTSAAPGVVGFERGSRATLVLGLSDEGWRIMIVAPWG